MLGRQTGILDNTAPIVCASTGSCLGMVTIRWPSVMTMCLPRYVEANLLERPNGPEVRYPGYLRHALDCDIHFPSIMLSGDLSVDLDVCANRVLNVRQSLFFSGAL